MKRRTFLKGIAVSITGLMMPGSMALSPGYQRPGVLYKVGRRDNCSILGMMVRNRSGQPLYPGRIITIRGKDCIGYTRAGMRPGGVVDDRLKQPVPPGAYFLAIIQGPVTCTVANTLGTSFVRI